MGPPKISIMPLLVVGVILTGLVGWGFIEGVIWLFTHIKIAIA